MTQNEHLFYWFFGIVFMLTVAIIAWSIRYTKKRAQEMAEVATQIGFTYRGKDWRGPALSSEHKISLLQRTRGRFSNVMTGSAGGFQVSLFDYTYIVGKSTVTRTLACFFHDMRLPPFELRPEGFFDRIGDALVHKDIDFDSHPEFSKRYLLWSPDEAVTRKLFAPSLLAFMEEIPVEKKWHVEATTMILIVYGGDRPVRPSDIPLFLDETSAIARTILSSARQENLTT